MSGLRLSQKPEFGIQLEGITAVTEGFFGVFMKNSFSLQHMRSQKNGKRSKMIGLVRSYKNNESARSNS